MKFIILLSIVAFCSAYPYQSFEGFGYGSQFGNVHGFEHDVHVNHDGSLTITTPHGNEITVVKGMGLNHIVTVNYPSVSHGYFNYYNKYQPSHVGILEQIISQYEGQVTPATYQLLLGDVYAAVQKGLLDDDVFWAFHNYQLHHYPYTYPISGDHGVLGQHWFGKYGYPVGQHISSPLSEIVENEKVILDHQDEIHEDQKLQHLKQEQLTWQQYHHQQEQEQQQIQQHYVQQLQEQVQGEQVHVLEHQKYQQQYPVNYLHGSAHLPLVSNYWQHQPSTYLHRGLYGLYGQGNQWHNVPMVY